MYVIYEVIYIRKAIDLFKKHYKYFFIIIIVIILGTATYIQGKGGDEGFEDPPSIPISIPEQTKDKEEVQDYVIFDIKGAVNNPGAYKLNMGSRIYDAIRVSGGLSKDADTTLINLSKKLTDEMVIIIHTRNQVIDYTIKEPTIIYEEVPCVCPELKNDGCITEEPTEKPTNSKVSLNTASLEELITLPGIGEAKAKSIIEYRNTFDGFKSIEELLEVKGIGESVFNSLKDLITT